jgi:lysophospholipase L1-like esterase
MRRWLTLSLCLGVGVAAAAYAVAIYRNPTDRLEQIARASALVASPDYVFIGDSLTKSGGLWGRRLGGGFRMALNLAQNGANTSAVADQAKRAAGYRPRRIVVMAGTNDAPQPTDAAALREAWRRLFAAIGTTPAIVFLPPRSAHPVLNNNLRDIDPIVREAAAQAGACLRDLNGTLAPNGVLAPEYTTDGVHFTEKAYAVWVAGIAEAARTCGK